MTEAVQTHPQMADIDEILYSAEAIKARVAELGAQITRDYAAKEIFLLAILRGASVFLADLSRHIDCHTMLDFMVVSRYGNQERPGEVRILRDLDFNIKGRDVLVVEDIIDEGETLSYLLGLLRLREPCSLKVVTIFDKPTGRKVEVQADYVGFVVPPRFVVGYGLDYKQQYRNLPFLGTMRRDKPYPKGEDESGNSAT